jgi:peptidoglycan DL-endopeptidase CwlO
MIKKTVISTLLAALVLTQAPLESARADTAITGLNIVKGVNFRLEPKTSSPVIRLLSSGEKVDVLSQPNSFWYEVRDSAGRVGYVSSSSTYVDPIHTELPPAQPGPSLVPNGEVVASVNFRKSPSTDGERIRFLQKGELVTIVEKVNSYWYKILDKDNVTGYVSTSASYIDSSFEQSQEPLEEEFNDTLDSTILKSVSFRTGPSTSANRVRYLKAGEKVLVLDKPNNYWYKVKTADGSTGYVSTDDQYIDAVYTEPYKQMDPAVAIEAVIQTGAKYMGTPYEFGSDRYTTFTFDCSDFVRQAFLEAVSLRLPGDSRSQAAYVKEKGNMKTDWKQLKRGDLVFFMSYKGFRASDYAGIDKLSQTVTHVGIYLGNGQILHTYSVASGGVRYDTMETGQWNLRFMFGGSAL